MHTKTIFILNLLKLYEILSEVSSTLNFDLKYIDQKDIAKINLKTIENYLFLSDRPISNKKNIIILKNFPYKLASLIETINLNFLKNYFNNQSEFKIGRYTIDVNARKIKFKDVILDVTEKECKLILFINSIKKASLTNIQKEVWGHQSDLETHTVETHIYRLRKKFLSTFKDKDFIKLDKDGYYLS